MAIGNYLAQLLNSSGLVPTAKMAFDSGSLAMRNRIINGDMRIAQRATTYALTTSVAYGCMDRWAFAQDTTANAAASQVASGLTGFQYALKLGRNSGATTTGYVRALQVLETTHSIPLAGQTVTLSFWAKAGANFSASGNTINPSLYSGTGTDQSVGNMVAGSWTGNTFPIGSPITLTTSWVRYSTTGTVPSSSTQLGVSFTYLPTGTAGADDNVYITGVQLEIGSTSTPFEHRQYSTELALCQRYYETSGFAGYNYFGGAGANWSVLNYPFKVDKRSAPTIAFSGMSYSTCSTIVATTSTTSYFYASVTATSAGGGSAFGTFTASAEL